MRQYMHQQPLQAPYAPKRSSSAGHSAGVSGRTASRVRRGVGVPDLRPVERGCAGVGIESCIYQDHERIVQAVRKRGNGGVDPTTGEALSPSQPWSTEA